MCASKEGSDQFLVKINTLSIVPSLHNQLIRTFFEAFIEYNIDDIPDVVIDVVVLDHEGRIPVLTRRSRGWWPGRCGSWRNRGQRSLYNAKIHGMKAAIFKARLTDNIFFFISNGLEFVLFVFKE